MGWGDCGNDSDGRPIGYVFEAECDFPGCKEAIDRGLSFACGDMHGECNFNGIDCDKYFCGKHMSMLYIDGETKQICKLCCDEMEKNYDEWGFEYDEEEDEYKTKNKNACQEK